MTTELQTECGQSEQVNSFLANRPDAPGWHDFLAHLGVCETCASALRDLREDERLARVPLTAAERSQIRAIVAQARQEVSGRLETDRRRREESPRLQPPVLTAPPRLTLPSTSPRRVLWLAIAAALVRAAVAWWLFEA
jgi:hypothetical protein